MTESQIATARPQPPAPYAETWKEFDLLEQRAKDVWFNESILFVLALFTGTLRGFDPWIVRTALILEGTCGLVLALMARRARSRFEHWTCPRCHAEWPGRKLEKYSHCAICGLKLHQVTP